MMNNSSAPLIKRRTAVIGWLTIFTQAALPVGLAFAPAASAAQATHAEQAKWYQSGQNAQSGKSPFDNNNALAPVGAATSQDGSSAAAAGMARSAAAGALNNSVEAWLSQFGTARVQLNMDEKFKVNGSEADVLLPIYDNKSTLLFTQLGLRHVDGRNTSNIGLGVRQTVGEWMLGTNAFFDNDFTGENRRMGVGVEAWRDYLKLSANGYLRLTDWHQSRDFADYDERPANGYDVRAEGWLPAFPQLGAKVMFEQYRGNEVALFGKDNRQQDPWAFTGGATYTPVPLVTVGAQHRAGKSGQSDSQLSLQMNYRLGESWSKQLDPNLVGASRTLSGTRYDLVERNNTIVLDYRKQESVTLVLPEKSSGKGGSTLPINFTVTSKSPLQRIDWDASTLIAAGGSITQVGNNQLSVVLPPYQAAGSNVYRFAGVAYDTNGTRGSASADIHVEVGDVNAGATKVSANPTSLIADGKSTSTLSIELFDDQSNPVPGMAASLTASLNETLAANQPSVSTALQAATLGAISEAAPGVYQATLTAGTRVGTVVVSSQFNDSALPDITITESADAATGHIAAGAILATVDNSVANGAAMNQVSAIITDAGGNPLANTAVTFSLTGSATVAPGSSLNATTDENGQVSLSLISTVAAAVTVTATLDNGNTGSIDTRFIADASTATMSNGDVTVDKNSVIANNADAATFTAVVKDANGNAVPNFTVNWSNDNGTLSAGSSTTDASGLATVTLKHTVAEAAQVVAQAGQSGSINAPVVSFTADDASATIGAGDLSVDETSRIANNVEFSTYTAVVKDAGGNPVPNATVTWATDLGTLSGTTSSTDANGQAIITLKSTAAGTAQVTASVNNAAAVNADAVTFTADDATAIIDSGDVNVDKATVVADGTQTATFTAQVKDAHGNVLPNFTVNWATDKGALSGNTSTTDANGNATITLKDTLTGAALVSVQAGSSASVNAPVVNFIANPASATLGSGDVNVDKTTLIADNVEVATFSAVVKDANGNVVPDFAVNWATDKGTLSGNSSTTDANGLATVTLKDTVVGIAQVTAQAGNSADIEAPKVDFTANAATGAIDRSDLTVDKNSVVADNADFATYSAIVKDANGNVVPDITVTWATDAGDLSTLTSATDSTGIATVTLKGTVAGLAQVTAAVNSATPTDADAITFTADAATATVEAGNITVDNATLIANDSDAATYSAIVKDAHGNVVPNLTVNWTTDKGTLSANSSSTDVNGLAQIILKSTAAGTAQVVVQAGTSGNVNAPEVNFSADSASATIGAGDLSVDETTRIANDVEFSTYTAVVKDAGGNPVSNATVTWTTDLGTLSGTTSDTNAAGQATITLKSTLAGAAQATAAVNNKAAVDADTVIFTADGSTAVIGSGDLTVDETTVVANGSDVATYTAIVKDAHGNPVSGFTVNWTTTHGTLSGTSSTTGINGEATITLKGTIIGDAIVTGTVNASGTPAESVTFIADVTTAQVTTLTPSIAKITGTGAESSTLTATVKDANGNTVANHTVNWSTTLGTLTESTSQTDDNGQTTVDLSAAHVATTNGTAVVNAIAVAGNKTANVTVRAVILAGGKYYWTMYSDRPSNVEATAQNYCATYGGGSAVARADLQAFATGGGDFARMTVSGEYGNNWYSMAGTWASLSGDFHSDASAVGVTNPGPGSTYACVK